MVRTNTTKMVRSVATALDDCGCCTSVWPSACAGVPGSARPDVEVGAVDLSGDSETGSSVGNVGVVVVVVARGSGE